MYPYIRIFKLFIKVFVYSIFVYFKLLLFLKVGYSYILMHRFVYIHSNIYDTIETPVSELIERQK